MGLENGIIQAPFNTATVSSAIGKASGDVGTLCMAGEPYINKWSRMKPIYISPDYDRPYFTNFATETLPQFFWGFDKDKTMNIDINNVLNLAKANNFDWNYLSNSDCWCRLTDFEGYNVYSIPPIRNTGTAETTYNGVVSVSCRPQTPSIDMSDILMAINNNKSLWRFGVIYKSTRVSAATYLALGDYAYDGNELKSVFSCDVNLVDLGMNHILPVFTIVQSVTDNQPDIPDTTFFLPKCDAMCNYSPQSYPYKAYPYMPNVDTPPITNIVRDDFGYIQSFNFIFTMANEDSIGSVDMTLYLIGDFREQSITIVAPSSFNHTIAHGNEFIESFSVNMPTQDADSSWGFKSYYTANNDIRWIDLSTFSISTNEPNIVTLDTLLNNYNITL